MDCCFEMKHVQHVHMLQLMDSKQALNVAAIHNDSYVNNLLFYLLIIYMQ